MLHRGEPGMSKHESDLMGGTWGQINSGKQTRTKRHLTCTEEDVVRAACDRSEKAPRAPDDTAAVRHVRALEAL